MRLFSLTSRNDNAHDEFNRLDDIYKFLLTPTTFYILISWLFWTHCFNLVLEHPRLWPLDVPFTEELLLTPINLVTYEAGSLGISVILFLIFVFVRSRKLAAAGRLFAFWTLFFVLFLTSFTFIQAMYPFRLFLPLLGGTLILVLTTVSSGLLSGYLVWKGGLARVKK